MKNIILFSMLFGFYANATGVLEFDAKVDSFDENNVILVMKDSRKIKVQKSNLSSDQQKNLKPGGTIQLSMNEKEIAKSVVKTKK